MSSERNPAMTSYVALLRAVNVGGTGKLPMADLRAMCTEVGFTQVQTLIASGNVVFQSPWSEAQVQRSLEDKLLAYAGKPVGVLVRTAAQLCEVLANNPFKAAVGSQVLAIFLNDAPKPTDLLTVKGQRNEELAVGEREIYVHYGSGMGTSKLIVPTAKAGTARNMNTVARLAEMLRVQL